MPPSELDLDPSSEWLGRMFALESVDHPRGDIAAERGFEVQELGETPDAVDDQRLVPAACLGDLSFKGLHLKRQRRLRSPVEAAFADGKTSR